MRLQIIDTLKCLQANQSSYQRALTVLSRIQDGLYKDWLISRDSIKVMLLYGSDLLESFSIPGAWILDQVFLAMFYLLSRNKFLNFDFLVVY
ncbi:hypothetical protein KSP40_PGU012942 [Platanthera guangdongensis]|uniref:Uncharacterized protein n=1 Tax=Platanthera guangdongensis TaxID=2320717 RepID=A0ABR2LNG8_9ASPA